jgi:chemotaxis protein MotB
MPLKNAKNKQPDEVIVHKHEEHLEHPSDDESGWLVSYADMMTLLCGFFIMLFSMAKMDTPKYDSFREEVSKQFGGEYTSPTKELAKYATQVIQEMGVESPTTVKSDSQGISIVFESTILFPTLSAEMTPEGQKILKKLIDAIALRQKENGKIYHIVVEGHTDGRPVIGGRYPSNWELSGARASRVVRMFLDKNFTANRLTAIGYADTHPQIQGRTPAGTWDDSALTKNRRVVLRILEPGVDAIPFAEDMYTVHPGGTPSSLPSSSPSANPSMIPSSAPSIGPSAVPSSAPSIVPTAMPSNVPSATPNMGAAATTPSGDRHADHAVRPGTKRKIRSLSELLEEPEPATWHESNHKDKLTN